MTEQIISESKNMIRELTLDEIEAVSGGDGLPPNPPPPIIDTRPSPDPSNPLGS